VAHDFPQNGVGDPAGHTALYLLQRNLIYTGITRGKRLLVLVGQKKALTIAVRNDRPQRRYSGLLASLRGDSRAATV
jgi:exodeoxyribonuclease V alpha subunit